MWRHDTAFDLGIKARTPFGVLKNERTFPFQSPRVGLLARPFHVKSIFKQVFVTPASGSP